MAFVPHHCYDPSPTQGSNSPWLRLLRMKKDLSHICKATYWPGMRVLYGDIVLRRMGQISALARTLRSPEIGNAIGAIVRVVRIDSCPVLYPCADAIEEDLVFILSRFTTLRSFAYHPHPQFHLVDAPYDSKVEDGLFNPTWFFQRTSQVHIQLVSHTGSRLRHLDLSIDLQDDSTLHGIHSILMNAAALATLRLTRYDYPGLIDRPGTAPAVDYPDTMVHLSYLSDLTIDLSARNGLQTYVCARWHLPSLTHLTLLLGKEGDSRDPTALLKRFGARILYLHFSGGTRSDSGVLDPVIRSSLTSDLDTLFPEIQHLILSDAPHHLLAIRSKTLRRLDIWVSSLTLAIPHGPPIKEWTQSTVRDAFVDHASAAPSLAGVRLLVATWSVWYPGAVSIRGTDWPKICAPELLAAGAPDEGRGYIVHRFPTRWIVQTALAVLPFDEPDMKNVVAMLGAQEGVTINEFLHWKYSRRELRQTWTVLAGEEEGWKQPRSLGTIQEEGSQSDNNDDEDGDDDDNSDVVDEDDDDDDNSDVVDDDDYETDSESETEDEYSSEGEPEEEYLEDDIEEEEVDTEVVDREAILDAFSRIQPSCEMHE